MVEKSCRGGGGVKAHTHDIYDIWEGCEGWQGWWEGLEWRRGGGTGSGWRERWPHLLGRAQGYEGGGHQGCPRAGAPGVV